MHGMGGVDLMDQCTAAYRLDRRARFRFYLRIFFDLWDVGCANFYIVFNQIFPKRLEFLDYKIAVGEALICAFCSRERSFPSARASKRRFSQVTPTEASLHLPEYKAKRSRCMYCLAEGADHKTFVAQLAKSHYA